jgi:hypothetical protein
VRSLSSAGWGTGFLFEGDASLRVLGELLATDFGRFESMSVHSFDGCLMAWQSVCCQPLDRRLQSGIRMGRGHATRFETFFCGLPELARVRPVITRPHATSDRASISTGTCELEVSGFSNTATERGESCSTEFDAPAQLALRLS